MQHRYFPPVAGFFAAAILTSGHRAPRPARDQRQAAPMHKYR